MLSQPQSRHTIRSAMRRYRRALTPLQQKRAACALKKQLAQHPLFIRSQRIAFYLSSDGEIDPYLLLDTALKMGKECYLPALLPHDPKAMWFIRYNANTPMQKNRYGILEPKLNPSKRLKAKQLQLVLMPLVAFDQSGGRLGMGGGYYDRCFSFKAGSTIQTPYLLGLAHDGQRSSNLPLEHWDIPLSAIATDKQFICCTKA